MSIKADISTAESIPLVYLGSAAAARIRRVLMSAETVAALAETFRVLGDPTRVRILDALSHGELCVGDLACLLGHTESAVSHQLRLLRGMRLVRARRAGRLVFYRLDDEHIVGLFGQAMLHVAEASAASGAGARTTAEGARRHAGGSRAGAVVHGEEPRGGR
jgi:ArsR family transcriptional regulator, lead/cadmium/zinc/bismuth-responsive transcriptional repressor